MSDFVPFPDTPKDIFLSDHAGFEQRKPYSIRIPAAIAKLEPFFERYPGLPYFKARGVIITATEVALAKALWEENDQHLMGLAEFVGCKGCQALIAFTEKVEQLS